MSIFIKGIEMPQAGDVIVCGQIDGKLQGTIVTRGKQTKWCEILEIPTPHDDLLDRNDLLDEINLMYPINSSEYSAVFDMIADMDAVIERE